MPPSKLPDEDWTWFTEACLERATDNPLCTGHQKSPEEILLFTEELLEVGSISDVEFLLVMDDHFYYYNSKGNNYDRTKK